MEENNFVTNEYIKGSRLIHSIFNSTKQGKDALDFLERVFMNGFFNDQNPSEGALYKQGQTSVIAEIKSMIYAIENGLYEEK